MSLGWAMYIALCRLCILVPRAMLTHDLKDGELLFWLINLHNYYIQSSKKVPSGRPGQVNFSTGQVTFHSLSKNSGKLSAN